MSSRVWKENGRFARQKTIDKRNKALQAMAQAKKRNKEDRETTKQRVACEGFRLVNIHEMQKNTICKNCQNVLDLNNITDETLEGAHSILKIDCLKCSVENVVHTSKKVTLDGHTYSEVNISLVLGSMYSGMGCTGVQKLLSCIDSPNITMDMHKKYERLIGPAIEKEAKDSCKRAAEEERRLVIEYVEKLSETL